jgi:hypothetical protein
MMKWDDMTHFACAVTEDIAQKYGKPVVLIVISRRSSEGDTRSFVIPQQEHDEATFGRISRVLRASNEVDEPEIAPMTFTDAPFSRSEMDYLTARTIKRDDLP